MARLIYATIASLDGYVEDERGSFDWAEPDQEVFSFVNELERPIGTYLYGRRLYETMVFWETAAASTAEPLYVQEFAAIWRAAEKVVYSRTLDSVSSLRTRLERRFRPEAVRLLKAAADRDLTVGGPGLAGEAISAHLVDELQLLVVPVVLGGGKPWLPSGVRFNLELVDTRRFANGVVYCSYRPAA
ncbi:MAG: dihydrofolate reductase family protein [Candidatus Dormibacteria bacterium]